MHTTSELLGDLAQRFRVNADRLELEAAGLDAQADGQAATIGVGNDWSRANRGEAAAKRAEAAWLRRRADAAAEGKFLFNPTDPAEATDPAAATVRARCASEGRLVPLDARQARLMRETLAQETV